MHQLHPSIMQFYSLSYPSLCKKTYKSYIISSLQMSCLWRWTLISVTFGLTDWPASSFIHFILGCIKFWVLWLCLNWGKSHSNRYGYEYGNECEWTGWVHPDGVRVSMQWKIYSNVFAFLYLRGVRVINHLYISYFRKQHSILKIYRTIWDFYDI